MWRTIILSCGLLLSANACALERDPFGVLEVSTERLTAARKKIIKEIGEEVLTNLPSRVEMTKGLLRVKLYSWPNRPNYRRNRGNEIYHALIILFHQQNKKFSQNVCEYLEQYPDALIGTVYVEYHTIKNYEPGETLETDLEFKERTECRPGLEKYFQERFQILENGG